MKVLPSLFLDGPSDGAKPGCQRNGLKIVNRHVASERDNSFLSIHFAHGFVQYGRDDATVDMVGRTLKATRNPKFAGDTAIVRGFLKSQVQSVSIFLGAAEAVMDQSGDGPIECMTGTGRCLAWMCMFGSLQRASILFYVDRVVCCEINSATPFWATVSL